MKYLIFFGLVFLQSMSFTFISRARNRNKNKVAVLSSRLAFNNFMGLLNPDDWFELEIKDGID